MINTCRFYTAAVAVSGREGNLLLLLLPPPSLLLLVSYIVACR
jgi:hypothetical protein